MRKESKSKTFFSILLVFILFLSNGITAYGQKDSKVKNLSFANPTGQIMQYSARPEVAAASWIGTGRDKIAVEYSDEMETVGKYSVINPGNYEISIDNGKSWISFSTIRIQSIEALDINSKVIITLGESLPKGVANFELLRVAEVANKDDKRTLTSSNTVQIGPHEVDIKRIQNITAISLNRITIETDFRVMKLNSWAFSYEINGERYIPKVEYKNNDKGSLITLLLDNKVTLKPNISNLSSVSINTGGLMDYFGNTNLQPITFKQGQICDGIEPSITEAKTIDRDHNGRIDEIQIAYDEVVKSNTNAEAAIKVDGYSVKSVKIEKSIVSIFLIEKKTYDTGSTPFVQLYGNICDFAGNIPVEDTDGVSVKDGVSPMVISASIIYSGKKPGFGNDRGDAISIKFSEPVLTKFQNARFPQNYELFNLIECIANGESLKVFMDGKYECKDMSEYPSAELVLVVNTRSTGDIIHKGDLLKLNICGLVKDVAGHDIYDSKGLIRVK